MGLNITVMSYCGSLDFGLVGDPEQMPDLWALMDWLREALEELKPRRKPRAERPAKPRRDQPKRPASRT